MKSLWQRVRSIRATVLLLAVLVGLSGPAVSASHGGVLRALFKVGDEIAGAGRGLGKAAVRHADLLDDIPAVPGRTRALLRSDGARLRLYAHGMPDEGVLYDSFEESIVALRDRFAHSALDLVVDENLVRAPRRLRAFRSTDRLFLKDGGGSLSRVRWIEVGGERVAVVRLQPGLLVRLSDDVPLHRTREALARPFHPSEATVARFFDPAADAGTIRRLDAASGGAQKVDLRQVEDLDAFFRETSGRPVLVCGHVSDGRLVAEDALRQPIASLSFSKLEEAAQAHDCPLLILGCRSVPEGARSGFTELTNDVVLEQGLSAAMRARTVRGFLGAFGDEAAPLVVDRTTIEAAGRVRISARREWTEAGGAVASPSIVTMLRMPKRGLRTPLPRTPFADLFALFVVWLIALPAGAIVGQILTWPFRYWPSKYRVLKFGAIGAVPFLPFGLDGVVAAMMVALHVCAVAAFGWLASRPFRFRPQERRIPKYAAFGYIPVLGITFVMILFLV